MKRDREYVGIQMKIRAKQARDDWRQERKIFMSLKDRLVGNAKDEKEKNRIKREVKALKKSNERKFIQLRRVHDDKIGRLEQTLRRRKQVDSETNRRQELAELREQWLQRMVSKEEPPKPPPPVPIYGQAKLDKDEINGLILPINFTSY